VAESMQLGRRGRIQADEDSYFAIIQGKTAALFRAALYAGARAGDLEGPPARALEAYGADLGLAFQIIDDVLDLAGDPVQTGKVLFTDLREGKMTYPLLLAVQRETAPAGGIVAGALFVLPSLRPLTHSRRGPPASRCRHPSDVRGRS